MQGHEEIQEIQSESEFPRSHPIVLLGSITSILFLSTIYYFIVRNNFDDLSIPDKISSLALCMSVISSFWLIVNVVGQSNQISLQRSELKFQRRELMLMRNEITLQREELKISNIELERHSVEFASQNVFNKLQSQSNCKSEITGWVYNYLYTEHDRFIGDAKNINIIVNNYLVNYFEIPVGLDDFSIDQQENGTKVELNNLLINRLKRRFPGLEIPNFVYITKNHAKHIEYIYRDDIMQQLYLFSKDNGVERWFVEQLAWTMPAIPNVSRRHLANSIKASIV